MEDWKLKYENEVEVTALLRQNLTEQKQWVKALQSRIEDLEKENSRLLTMIYD